MKVKELKKLLECADDEMEVYLAIQPNWPWPFTYTVGEVVIMDEETLKQRCRVAALEEGVEFNENEVDKSIAGFYIAEASQKCYLPGTIAQELGWS
jgi:hypothetical protein